MTVTPDEIDQKQAADLMVLTAGNVKIACRLRRRGYVEKYRYEFTIRALRDSGAETELSKITNGWGDWMFYVRYDVITYSIAARAQKCPKIAVVNNL